MEPITIAVLAVAGALFVAFWAHIQLAFQDHVIPFVREILGDSVAQGLVWIISKLDNAVTNVSKEIKRVWKAFRKHVLKSEELYERQGPNDTQRVRTTYVQGSDGKVMRRTETETLDWDEVPQAVRNSMVQNNTRAGRIDITEAVERQASKNGLLTLME